MDHLVTRYKGQKISEANFFVLIWIKKTNKLFLKSALHSKMSQIKFDRGIDFSI